MPLIKNEHGVYVSGYYFYEFKNKTPKCDFRISLADTPAGRVYAYGMSSSIEGMGTPLMDGGGQSRQEAILCALRQLYKKFHSIDENHKILKVIMQFVNDHKSNPDDHFKAHFTLQVVEEETQEKVSEYPTMEGRESNLTQEEKMHLLDKHFPEEVPVKETKKESKPKLVAKVNETANKEQQFNVGDTVKCIDTGGLNSLFLGKQYTVEGIHTAVVGENTYEQIRVYGLLYSTKYFILVP